MNEGLRLLSGTGEIDKSGLGCVSQCAVPRDTQSRKGSPGARRGLEEVGRAALRPLWGDLGGLGFSCDGGKQG